MRLNKLVGTIAILLLGSLPDKAESRLYQNLCPIPEDPQKICSGAVIASIVDEYGKYSCEYRANCPEPVKLAYDPSESRPIFIDVVANPTLIFTPPAHKTTLAEIAMATAAVVVTLTGLSAGCAIQRAAAG